MKSNVTGCNNSSTCLVDSGVTVPYPFIGIALALIFTLVGMLTADFYLRHQRRVKGKQQPHHVHVHAVAMARVRLHAVTQRDGKLIGVKDMAASHVTGIQYEEDGDEGDAQDNSQGHQGHQRSSPHRKVIGQPLGNISAMVQYAYFNQNNNPQHDDVIETLHDDVAYEPRTAFGFRRKHRDMIKTKTSANATTAPSLHNNKRPGISIGPTLW